MFRLKAIRTTAIVLAVLVLFGSVQALAQNVAVLRVESLDAASADIKRVSELLGKEFSRDTLLMPLQQATGLHDLSWLDTTRPLVIVFPMEGMALAQKGLVTAVPVGDAVAAVAALEQALGPAEPDATGVRQYVLGEGNVLALAQRGGYLVIGQAKDLVGRFDPKPALEIPGAPAGSMVLDIYLEPVAPMAMMGLQAGRQMLEQKMIQDAAAGEQPGGDASEGEAAPEGEAPPEVEVTTPDFDPAQVMSLIDIYFDLIRDLLNNASRIQVSLELASQDILLHKRIVPKAGSTLAGMVEAQKGGFPEVAKFIEPGDHFGVGVGQLTFTPAFKAAMDGYAKRYFAAVGDLMGALEKEIPEGFEWIPAMMKMMEENSGNWLDCYRGDFASSFSFAPGGGFYSNQIVGVGDEEACNELIAFGKKVASELPAGPDGEPMVSVVDNALEHRGVTASMQTFRLSLPEGIEGAGEAQKMISMMFGESGIESYYGITGGYMITATGPDGEATFRNMVDRIGAKKKKREKMTGLTPEVFAPLKTGPGFFMAMDIGGLFEAIAGMLPSEGADASEAEELKAFFAGLPEGASELAFGATFRGDSVHGSLAVPMGLFEAIGRKIAEEEAKKAAEHEEAEQTQG